MSRNIVPRVDKGADLGTSLKNWNRLYADAVILRGSDLQALLNGKTDLETLTAKGDLYVATEPGVIVRLPRGEDGTILTTNSLKPEGLEWSYGDTRQPLTSNIYVSVGSGGDFETINQALDSVTALYAPRYRSLEEAYQQSSEDYHLGVGIFPRITIRLLPGFVMSEQVLIEALDLSWITIEGDDDETIINKSALTTQFYGRYPAFGAARGGFLPIIGQLFNMDTSSTGETIGIQVVNNAAACISSNCGIKNVTGHGIFSRRSNVYAKNAIFSGASIFCIYAERASMVNANGVIATNSQYIGIRAESGSIVNATNANASGAVVVGFDAYRGGIINAYNSTGSLSQSPNTLTSNGIIFK